MVCKIEREGAPPQRYYRAADESGSIINNALTRARNVERAVFPLEWGTTAGSNGSENSRGETTRVKSANWLWLAGYIGRDECVRSSTKVH